MRQLIARWIVSRSIDCGRETPRWLRSWLASDETIKFEASARRLIEALERDAPAWRTLAPRTIGATHTAGLTERITERLLAWRWMVVSLVALILLTTAILHREKQGTVDEQPSVAASIPATEESSRRDGGELRIDATVFEALRRWRIQRIELETGELLAWLPSARLDQPTALVRALSFVPGGASRVAAAVSHHGTSQAAAICAKADSAFEFFAFDLPESTARAVGYRRLTAIQTWDSL